MGVELLIFSQLWWLWRVAVEGAEDETEETASDCGVVAARYRVERDLWAALVPLSSRLFDQINGQAGGLKFLVDLRADLKASLQYDDAPYHNLSAAAAPIDLTLRILIVNLSRSHIPSSGLRCRVLWFWGRDVISGCYCRQKNLASLRALDSDLKGMFATWLGPACLELHQITWNDPACLLEKIVTYEAGSTHSIGIPYIYSWELFLQGIVDIHIMACVVVKVNLIM